MFVGKAATRRAEQPQRLSRQTASVVSRRTSYRYCQRGNFLAVKENCQVESGGLYVGFSQGGLNRSAQHNLFLQDEEVRRDAMIERGNKH
jgi:hypothetical protein